MWILVLALLGVAMAGSRATRAAVRHGGRRLPVGPQVLDVRGPWVQIADPDERRRRYAHDLAAAYRAAGLPEVAVPLAVTHSMFATGAWHRDGPRVWNNNIGVVRAGPTWPGPWVALSTREVLDDRGTVDPSDDIVEVQRGQAWRAYPTLEAGARGVLRIWQQQRYRAAWRLLLRGDASWSRVLGEHGYYTANPVLFERGYRVRLRRVRALLEGGAT